MPPLKRPHSPSSGPSGPSNGASGSSTTGSAFSGAMVNPNQTLSEFLPQFWTNIMTEMETDGAPEIGGFREHELPLARIKKVMKSDEDVKMISAEAPLLLSHASSILIRELSSRAFLISTSLKRRTLQRSDVSAAIKEGDMFDFLVDIEGGHTKKEKEKAESKKLGNGSTGKKNVNGAKNGAAPLSGVAKQLGASLAEDEGLEEDQDDGGTYGWDESPTE